MKYSLLLIISLVSLIGFSQNTISRQVLGSMGSSFSNSSIDVNYTVGEAVIETMSSGSYFLAQGFQQPDGAIVGIEEISLEDNLLLYPNPTTSAVNIQFSGEAAESGSLTIRIFSLQGQLMFEGRNEVIPSQSGILQYDVSSFSPGNYFVEVTTNTGNVSRLKFVKN